jgi:molecular chaperone GrpE
MTQGPDNNRPEPYFSDRQPGEGAGPGPEAPASSFGAAQGNAPGSAYPRAGSQAAPEPTPAPAGGGTGSGQAAPAGAMPGAGQSEGDQPVGEAAAGQAGDPAALEALKAELAEAQARAAATHEQLLRALAENENIRRRAQEEIAKARKFAIEAFAESLLPVIDSLELALKVEAPTVESIREGVEATLRLMVSAFEKNQLVGIDPAGQKFDPNHHQAISTVPADSLDPPLPANHVAAVLQKGYLINDRVLRPALVTVVQG